MKKFILLFACLIISLGINAQNWELKAKNAAVKMIKGSLKAPSTFILTDGYGNKIPINKINAKYLKGKIEYDSIPNYKHDIFIDSIEYRYDNITGELLDSVVYYEWKDACLEYKEYYKRIYEPCYEVTFYYEAQNSYGGMVEDFAVVYVCKSEIISKFISGEKRKYTEQKTTKYFDIPITYKTPKIINVYVNKKKKLPENSLPRKLYYLEAPIENIKNKHSSKENKDDLYFY